MKVFATLFTLAVANVLLVALILGLQYLAFHGPDWLRATSNGTNELLVGVGVVTSLFLMAGVGTVLARIWD